MKLSLMKEFIQEIQPLTITCSVKLEDKIETRMVKVIVNDEEYKFNYGINSDWEDIMETSIHQSIGSHIKYLLDDKKNKKED